MKLTVNNVGAFGIKSGSIVVSDPCYGPGTWCAGRIEKVHKGEWNAKAVISDEGEWGKRVAVLIASHEDTEADYNNEKWEKQKFDIGVDSGQAGIYDSDEFGGGEDGEDSGWYDKCCQLTRKDAGIINGAGVVSSSGFGDGGYACYTITKNGQVVAVMIDYGLINREEEA